LRDEIAESAKKVERWIPAYGLSHELDWLKNMSDWCISKKRYWGLALPIWKCKCGHFTVIGSKEELKQKAVQGWKEFDGHSPHRPWIDKIIIKCEKCGAPVSRISEVGNPWLDAGIVPFSTLRPPADMHTISNGYPFDKSYWSNWFPADLVSESLPGQFRNWFYAILTMSTVLEQAPPFRILQGYASLRDVRGEEMHKSKGNAIWSDETAEKVGADVMRWMFAKHNPIQNLNFGYGTAKEIKKVLLTLWNIYSFFVTYANIDKFNPTGKKIDKQALTKLDKWILSRLNSLILNSDQSYHNFDIMSVAKHVERFFDDLSNWYVRRSRRRFWKSENDTDKETAYVVLYECLVKLLKTIAPIVPFWTENMYQNLVNTVDKNAPESIHLCDFPKVDKEMIDKQLESEVSLTRTLVSLGRAARNKVNIKIRQPLNEMVVNLPKDSLQLSQDDKEIIREELNIKQIIAITTDEFNKLLVCTAKPLFEKLGPKFAESLDKISDWIKSMSQDEIQKLIDVGSLKKEFDGRTLEISNEDIEISKKESEGWSIVTEGEYGVGISTTLTEELEFEGLVRELVHKIQLLRKEASFNLIDRIKIHYQTSPKLETAIKTNLDYLKNETLALEVLEGTAEGEISKDLDINGINAQVTLQRIKK
jgi:isoleucyl-tRNA synthetase